MMIDSIPCSAESAVGHVPLPVAQILARAMEGQELTREEGIALAELPDGAVGPLTAVADEVRRQRVGDIVTYVVNRNINFTNVCIIGCKF